MSKVLIVDDKQMIRDSVATTLVRAGLQAVTAPDGPTALAMIPKHRPAAVLTDLKMPDVDGITLLQQIAEIDPQLPVVLMAAFASVDTAVSAMKLGAFDYLQKPFQGDELVVTINRAIEHYQLLRENAALKQGSVVVSSGQARQLIGRSALIQRLRQQIQQVAASHSTVMICGESGTGKEVVAQLIHRLSPRNARMMLCVNCAALSANLLESELFGHEKGAFTGAEQVRKGRFELSDGGTLLLDEISEIGPHVQAKLLRVLQERQFERVGSSATMEVDVRVIATTNRDLSRAVAEGHFRQDLFYRLNVLPIHLPSLRERREDIPMLANHFLVEQAVRDAREPKRLDARASELMTRYDWPGNVRELENICQRAGVLATGQNISAAMLEPWLTGAPMSASAPDLEPKIADAATLEEVERQVILKTLTRYNGHRQRTAEALGIGVRTLGLKLKKWKQLKLVGEAV